MSVYQYMANASGARSVSVDIGIGRVLVTPSDAKDNDAAVKIARSIGDHAAEAEAQRLIIDALRCALKHAESERDGAVAKLAEVTRPTRPPARLFGVAFARFAGDGSIWLLSDRERGWGASGFRFTSWDDVFREFDVVVTGHGVDATSPWWSLENAPAKRTALNSAEVTP